MNFDLETILKAIPDQRALVVGDICLDRWCTYDPAEAEPSRETGIPRIAVTSAELTPGAGGTVANNLAALGAGAVAVLGVLGNDGNGWELRQALAARGIRHDLCITHPEICTFTYTKLLNATNNEEDQPRVDFINTHPLPEDAERRLIANLQSVSDFDVILISDQAETNAGGVVTPAVREAIAALAKQYPQKVLWADSRLRPEHFRNVILKPNEDEAHAACARIGAPDDFEALRRRAETPLLLVTHGKRGAMILRDDSVDWAPAVAVENPVDICGAGDSFSAGASLAYSITRDAMAAAHFGNLVASITIMKKGTGTASPEELRRTWAGLFTMNTLAIDIGGTKFTVAVFAGERMILRESRTTDREGGRDWMLDQIRIIVAEWQSGVKLDVCGIGFGGPVDFPSQRVTLSTHVGGWQDFDLPGWARTTFGVPVIMDNDANVGALGEAIFGAGKGLHPVFYMTLSTGIGGGIIEEGRVWRGADSYGGEIGHLTIRPDGPDCLCGAKGCFERMCGGLWLEKDHGRSAKDLMRDAAFVERYVVDLALGLKAAIMILNPARVVIGGGISKAGEALFAPLRAELRRQITSWSRARIDVLPAALGDDSILFGALALANERK